MRHVAVVTTSYPGLNPGSEAAGNFVADFSRVLSRQVRTTVIAAATETATSTDQSLTVSRFAVPRLPLSLLDPRQPRDWLHILRTLRAGNRALANLAATDVPDHILACWALPSGHWAQNIGRRYNIPFSIWALGSDIWALRKLPVVSGRLRTVLRAAANRYADGMGLAAEVREISGFDCGFLASTRQLEPISAKPSASGPPYSLAFLGRWHPNKGADLLIQALKHLTNEDWSAISAIRIHGGGPLENDILSGVDQLRAAGRPVMAGGYLNKQEAGSLIARADYVLLPSRIESIPVVFSDSVQLDTPIVATPVGDLPTLYKDYRFGILAESTTPESFAAAIRSALKSPVASFAEGMRRARPLFDLDSVVNEFLSRISGTQS